MVRRLGKYEILEELGHGSFGRVYRAFDPSVKRYVAIKVLSTQTDPELMTRFQAEAGTTGKLAHKNVVTVYEFGREGDVPYLVMELLSGRTLQDIITRKQPLSLLEKIEILYQVGEGLQAAHNSGVIHRDMKPANIMVLPDGTAKIMDFGIALVAAKDVDRKTRQGNLMGTVLYMAPEQFRGSDANPKTDLFSFGVICYELLTGKHPFAASDPRTVMFRIMSHEPEPLSRLVPEGSDVLESLVQRLIAKDRAFRVDKAGEALLDMYLVLLELRQSEAARQASSIEPLIQSGDFKAAQVRVDEVLRLDPSNSTARRWRTDLRKREYRAAVQSRVLKLIETAEDHFRERRFGEAIQELENAVGLDPENQTAQRLLARSRTALDNSRATARLIADARWDEREDRLDLAVDKLHRALELDPEHSDASIFLQAVNQKIRERAAAAAIQNAERDWEAKNHRSALDHLHAVPPESALAAKAASLRHRIEADLAEATRIQRREQFLAALDAARQAMRAGRLEECLAAVEDLQSRYPDQAEASQLAAEARDAIAYRKRAEQIARIADTARSLAAENRFNDARAAIESGLRAFDNPPALIQLLEQVKGSQKAYERARDVAETLRTARTLEQSGKLDDAILVLAQTLGAYPGERELEHLKSSLIAERDRRAYAAALEQLLAEARRLVTEGQPAEGVALLEASLHTFATEPAVQALLRSARQLEAARRETQLVQQAMEAAARCEQAGDFAGAMQQLEAAISRFGNRSELTGAVDRVRIKQREQERRRFLADAVTRITDALARRSWNEAEAAMAAAEDRYPGALPQTQFVAQVFQGRVEDEGKALEAAVSADFGADDLVTAERRLLDSRLQFIDEPRWNALWKQLTTRKKYRAAIEAAERARVRGMEEEAEELLRSVTEGAPDLRAAKLLESISQQRRQREAVERARREAVERERAARQQAVEAGRQEAAALIDSGDAAGAVSHLERLCLLFPESGALREDLETARKRVQAGLEEARRREEEQRRRAEEARRAEEEQEQRRRLSLRRRAIAAGRFSARELGRSGKLQAQFALLDRLCREYPDSSHLVSDRAAAAARLRDVIAAERSKAAALIDANRLNEAVALLEQLCCRFPASDELCYDRDNARRAQRQAIDFGRHAAAQQRQMGNLTVAVAELDRLCGLFPGNDDLLADRAQAISELRRREDEAEKAVRDCKRIVAGLLEEDEPGRALDYLDQLTARYPDASIGAERELVQQALAAKSRSDQISKGREQAAGLARQGRFDAAVEELTRLAGQFPDSTAIAGDLAAARDALREQERQALIRERREHARKKAESREFQDAIRELQALIDEHPDAEEARSDLEGVRSALAAHERATAIALGRSAAADLSGAQNYPEAIEALRTLLDRFPDSAEVRADLQAAEQALAAQRRRQEAISAGCQEADSLARNGNLPEAVALLRTLHGEFPDSAAIGEQLKAAEHRLNAVEREQAIAGGLTRAAGLSRDNRFREAAALLAHLADQFPDAPEVLAEKNLAEKALAEQERLEAERRRAGEISAGRENASRLMDLEQYQEAFEVLDLLAARYPESEDVLRDRKRTWVARELQQMERLQLRQEERALREWSRAAIAEGRRAAAHLAGAGELDEARGLLVELAEVYGDSTEIAADLAGIDTAIEERRRAAIERIRSEAAAIAGAGRYEQAIERLNQALDEFPGSPELSRELQVTRLALDKHKREEEDRRKAAIAAGRRNAADLVRANQHEEALALLDQLILDHEAPELHADREAIEIRLADRRRREEQARRQAVIAEGRRKSADLVRAGEHEKAIEVLSQLAEQFPDAPELARDRDATIARLGEKRKREEQARRDAQEREARERQRIAIAAGRQQAADLIRSGELRRAIERLDELAREFPAASEIRRDRDAAVKLEQRRRDELARREAALSDGRKRASALVASAEFGEAVELLNKLSKQFPEAAAMLEAEREDALRRAEEHRKEEEARLLAEEQARLARKTMEVEEARSAARSLIEARDPARALETLDQITRIYPDAEVEQERAGAEALREQIEAEERVRLEAEEQARRELERAAIEEGRRGAAALLNAGDFQGAIEYLDELARVFPHASEVLQDRDHAAAALERRKQEEKERSEREERENRERRAASIAAGREKAASLAGEGDLEQAIFLLDRLSMQFPDSLEIPRDRHTYSEQLEAARREAAAAREAEERRRLQEERDISKARNDAEISRRRSDFKTALDTLARIAERFPGNPGVEEDRARILAAWEDHKRAEIARREAEDRARREREAAEIAEARHNSAQRLEEGDYDGAIALLNRVAARYPSAAGIAEDLDRAHAELERHRILEAERRRAEELARRQREEAEFHAARAEAARHLREGRCAQAIAVLDDLAARQPENREIQVELQAAHAEWDRQRREADEIARREAEQAAIDHGRAQAMAAAAAGDYSAAEVALSQLAASYPAHPELEADLDHLRSEIAELQARRQERARSALASFASRQRVEAERQAIAERDRVEHERRRADQMARDGDLPGALAILDHLATSPQAGPELLQQRDSVRAVLNRYQLSGSASGVSTPSGPSTPVPGSTTSGPFGGEDDAERRAKQALSGIRRKPVLPSQDNPPTSAIKRVRPLDPSGAPPTPPTGPKPEPQASSTDSGSKWLGSMVDKLKGRKGKKGA